MSASKETLLKNDGFTLLEILIAITLLAFISIGIVSITEDAANTKERTTEINENNLQIETAMSRFEWDFLQIYSPLYFTTVLNPNANQNIDGGVPPIVDENGTPLPNQNPLATSPFAQQYYQNLIQRFERNEHFMAVSKEGFPIPRFYAPEKGVFEFFTSSNRRKVENQKQSHFAWVRYALAAQEPLPDEEDENPNIPKSLKSFVRYFDSDDPYSDKRINIDNERVKGAVLLRNVETLEFEYWNFDRRKWESSLRSVPGGESVIRGVKVFITWYDSYGNKRSTTRIFRTHWPMVTPKDEPVRTRQAPTGNQGQTTGTQTGDTGEGN